MKKKFEPINKYSVCSACPKIDTHYSTWDKCRKKGEICKHYKKN